MSAPLLAFKLAARLGLSAAGLGVVGDLLCDCVFEIAEAYQKKKREDSIPIAEALEDRDIKPPPIRRPVPPPPRRPVPPRRVPQPQPPRKPPQTRPLAPPGRDGQKIGLPSWLENTAEPYRLADLDDEELMEWLERVRQPKQRTTPSMESLYRPRPFVPALQPLEKKVDLSRLLPPRPKFCDCALVVLLEEAPVPLHTDLLWITIDDRGYYRNADRGNTPWSSLASAIFRDLKKGDKSRFVKKKVDRKTYFGVNIRLLLKD